MTLSSSSPRYRHRKVPPTTLPGGGTPTPGPKSYICVDVTLGTRQLEFLIDSGATPNIITEATRRMLGLEPAGGGVAVQGVAMGGGAAAPLVSWGSRMDL